MTAPAEPSPPPLRSPERTFQCWFVGLIVGAHLLAYFVSYANIHRYSELAFLSLAACILIAAIIVGLIALFPLRRMNPALSIGRHLGIVFGAPIVAALLCALRTYLLFVAQRH